MKGNKVPSEHPGDVRVGGCNFLQGEQKPIVSWTIRLTRLVQTYGLSAIDFLRSLAIPWCCSM